MPQQRIPDESPTTRLSEEHIDSVVFDMLLCEGWPWRSDEIARELGDAGDAADSVRRLIDTGLVHRFGSSYSRRAPPAGRPSYRSAPSDRRSVLGECRAAWSGRGAYCRSATTSR